MTEVTPGHKEPTSLDKLDNVAKHHEIDEKGVRTTDDLAAEPEFEPVVTPKTWVVVFVRRACIREIVEDRDLC